MTLQLSFIHPFTELLPSLIQSYTTCAVTSVFYTLFSRKGKYLFGFTVQLTLSVFDLPDSTQGDKIRNNGIFTHKKNKAGALQVDGGM